MNINLTLFGEMLTFAILVWVIMKYIWPPLMKAIQDRQEKIAAGLEAAQRGQRELKLIQTNAAEQIHQAKIKASTILDQANQQATAFIEEGKASAQTERAKILAQAKLNIEQEINKTKDELQQHVVDLVIATTEKLLQQKIDETTQKNLINKLITNI